MTLSEERKEKQIHIMPKALKILSNDLDSEDGVINSCLLEASEMITELHKERDALRKTNSILGKSLIDLAKVCDEKDGIK